MNLSKVVPDFSIYNKTKQKNSILANLLICSCFFLTIASFCSIILYIILNGIKHLSIDFFSINNYNSILPELINTIYIEFIALLIAVPAGVATALYLTQYGVTNKFLTKLIDFATEILASVPSILFGMFGYSLFCLILGLKCSILSGGLTMAICVLPTIVQTTKQALISIPSSYQHAAFALGANKLNTIFHIIIPCAAPGILTGIILAIGKIIGESAALLLTTGAGINLPSNFFSHIFSSGQTLSLHLYFLAGNSTRQNSVKICFAIATVLLAITLVLTIIAKTLTKHFSKI